jgi:hypothetical protein
MRSRESRETGYVGQNSEVQWLSSVQRQTEYTGAETRDQSGTHGPPGTGSDDVSARSDALHERRKNAGEFDGEASTKTITDATFYLDSDEMKFDMVVDPYGDPEAEVARRLFECYMETVHDSFPLVSHITNCSLRYGYLPQTPASRYPSASKRIFILTTMASV